MMIKKRSFNWRNIKEKFPEYNAKFYSNQRNFYIHTGLKNSLFSFDNYKILLEEIGNFLTEHLETNFSRVYPPKLIFSTRWKNDYIISKKIEMVESHDLTWEADNKFIPKYIPGDLKWYEKNGLDTWFLRNKCQEFLNNTDLNFKKRHIVNFD